MATTDNTFKLVLDKEFARNILPDITTINFTEQESAKMKSILMEETGSAHLFTYINKIYAIIGGNFKNPGKFLVIPFVNEKNNPHINIQKTM